MSRKSSECCLVCENTEQCTFDSINHLGQNIIFPLVLSTFPHPQIALFATALPVSCYAILDYFYLRQKRVQKRIRYVSLSFSQTLYLFCDIALNRRRNARKQTHDEFIQAKKREAEETALLLRENARRHVQSEKNSDGKYSKKGVIGSISITSFLNRSHNPRSHLPSLG